MKLYIPDRSTLMQEMAVNSVKFYHSSEQIVVKKLLIISDFKQRCIQRIVAIGFENKRQLSLQ